jgi:hypothetical protein
VRYHRIVLGVGIFLDRELLLYASLGIGKESPFGANRGAEFLQGVMVVRGDSNDPGVSDRDLRIKRREFQVLLVFLGAVVTSRQRENQRILALQLAQLARCTQVIGKLEVGKDCPRYHIGAHHTTPVTGIGAIGP